MKYFILASLSFFVSNVVAQKYNERPTTLGIDYGVAIPFGKFGAGEIADSSSGYATGGTNLNVNLSWLLSENIGVAAMISYSVNGQNSTTVRSRYDVYAKRISDTCVVSDLKLKKWSTMAYMAGGYFSYPLQKASFNFQLLLGYSKTEYPEADVIIYKDTSIDAIEVNQSAIGASSFCFDVGAGLKYNISEIMYISVDANYFSAYPEFEKVVTTSTLDPDETFKLNQHISLLNVTAGIGFRF